MLVHRRFVSPLGTAFDRSVDRAFDQLVAGLIAPSPRRSPVVDAVWREGSLVLTVDLPGVPADRIGVELTGRVLTLSAVVEPARSDDEPAATWQRSIKLGPALDPEQVSAHYADGRLTVTVAPVEVAEPPVRRIEIATGRPATPAVEAATETPAETTVETTPPIETTGTEG